MGHWHWGTSPRLATVYFFLPNFVAIRVWRQSLVSNVFRISCTTVIKISLIFSFYWKTEKGIWDFFVIQCVSDGASVLCYFMHATCIISMPFSAPTCTKSWRHHCWCEWCLPLTVALWYNVSSMYTAWMINIICLSSSWLNYRCLALLTLMLKDLSTLNSLP